MIVYFDYNLDRKLIQTFPGTPSGAGIYLMRDGKRKFFNCAPGEPSNEMPNYELIIAVERLQHVQEKSHKEQEKRARIQKLGLTVVKSN